MLVVPTGTLLSQNIDFKTYTVNDGLVANPVRKVIQDSKGFMWIATWEGLSKYDGNKFTNYTTANGLSFDMINDMHENASGRIYLAENNGSLDIIEHDRISVDTVHERVVVNSFFNTPEHKVFVGTDDKGLLQFTSQRWDTSATQPFNTIIDFAWLNDSLRIIINANFKPWVADKNLNVYSADISSNLIAFAARRDSHGRLWLCTTEGLKLISALQRKGEPIVFDQLPSSFRSTFLDGQTVTDLFEDHEGDYWISTYNGLVRLDNKGRFQRFTTRNGLPTNIVNNFYEDRENNIWACSQVGVVKIVMKNNLEYFGKEDGLQSDEVLAMISDNHDHIYVNNQTHILKIDLQKNTLAPVVAVADRNLFTSFALDSAGTVSALLTSKKLYEQNVRQPLLVASRPYDYLFCITKDAQGNYFIGSSGGLIIRTHTQSFYDTKLPFRITALLFDNTNHLWAGTWNSGLFRLTLQSASTSVQCKVENFSDLVPDSGIRTLYLDHEGNIWIGTRYKGAFYLTETADGKFHSKEYSQKDGLNSNWVKAITEDHDGNIWIGTLQGLNKLTPTGNGFRVFDFSRINHSYGAVNCIYASKNHELWYGGPGGLVRFTDDQLDTAKAPDVFLTSIQSKLPLAEQGSHKTISLPYTSNQFNFEFSAPSFINEKQILYSYRLAGSADTSWSAPANLHAVSYASLRPGDYRFEVRAIGWNGQPGSAKTFSFIIEKPFWQTWWFYLLVVFSSIYLLYMLYRYRLSQLIKLQKVRDRIATDLHDDIGSSLTNINILSELSSKTLDKPEHAQQFLKRISEEVGTTSQAMDDIIWNVNSKNDSVQETIERMRRFAAELFDNSTVNYHLEFDDAIHGKKMNMEQRRDVFLMYKEMLNNVYKHAGAETVSIVAKVQGNILHLDVKDDGKAFDAKAVTHRNGLKNLYQRTARWNGTIEVNSEPSKGTEIRISMPLSN
jgi:ligand-binding sensor domain-containing protein/two-component sensor histidine kinase